VDGLSPHSFSPDNPLTVYFAMDSFLGLFCESGSEWSFGGAEMQMYYLASGFAKISGVRVRLLTNRRDYISIYPDITVQHIKLPYYGDIVERLEKKHVPALLVWIAKKFIGRFDGRRRRKLLEDHRGNGVLLMSSLENPDIVHAAKRQGIKTVYRISGDALVDGTYAPDTLARTVVDQLLELSDAVVVQSKYQRHAYKENYGKDSTIILSGFPWSDPPKVPRKRQVLWVGRCVAVKRPWLLLELANRLPDAQFAFIAPPPDDGLYQEMEREVGELDNVTLIPGVPRAEISRYYAESAVVVNTSFTEGLPNTLIEACAAQTPYVTYSLDIRGLMSKEGIGDCAEGDMDFFAHLTRQYLDSDERRAEVGKKAFDYAHETWSLEVAVKRYLGLFDQLCNIKR